MAYGTITGWQAHATARGHTVPDSNAIGNTALERASDYIRHTYVLPYALDPSNPLVEEATYMAARFELETPNFFGQAYGPDSRKMLTEVQGIRWSILPGASADDPRPIIPAIDQMLRSIRRIGRLDAIRVV